VNRSAALRDVNGAAFGASSL
jgi:intraflagellar transport protein 122